MGFAEIMREDRRNKVLAAQGQRFLGLLGQPSNEQTFQADGPEGLLSITGDPGSGLRSQFEGSPQRLSEEVELARIESGLDIRGGAVGFVARLDEAIKAKAKFDEFQVTETRQNEKLRQAQDNWVQGHKLDLAQADRQAQKAVLDTLLTNRQIMAVQNNQMRAEDAHEIAMGKAGRLSQQDRNSLVQFKDDFFSVNDMMNLYQDGFAINDAGVTGSIEAWMTATKDTENNYDLARKAFYQREVAYQAAVMNRISGAAVNDAEVARLSKMFITATDDGPEVIQKLRLRHADIIRQQGDLREILTGPGQGFSAPAALNVQPVRDIFTQDQFAPDRDSLFIDPNDVTIDSQRE